MPLYAEKDKGVVDISEREGDDRFEGMFSKQKSAKTQR